jgi:hypothetical protein
MEDTEYLPTCGFKPIGRTKSEEIMKGKFLTKNIVLFLECPDKECGVVDKVDVVDLITHAWDDECHNCGAQMEFSEEFVVKD